jgi:protein O-GlcNAc transferase
MNIIFLDPIGWDYDVATPLERPLGGSQSALCYLAAGLVKRGHQVTLLSGTREPHVALGVRCRSAEPMSDGLFAPPCDAVVVLNGPADVCLRLRPLLAPNTLLVLWTQHAFDQPDMHTLARPEPRHEWDLIACVSDWHRSTMIQHYGLEPSQVVVRRNAIAPPFEGLFADEQALIRAKSSRLILTYTSTPFRGLDVMLSVFPEVRRQYQEAELHVYSSMKVYQHDEHSDPYRSLYESLRTTPGVKYIGAVSQSALAQAMREATVLSYPNTFAETSCIAVMEALAAGLHIVTSDLGALHETTMGFGTLVPIIGIKDREQFADHYLTRLTEVLQRWARDPEAFAAEHIGQVKAVNEHCTWQRRAAEWEEVLGSCQRARSRQSPGTGGQTAMTTLAQTLDLAIEHQQRGHLQQAEQLCRQILQTDPHHVDALHLLGVLAHQLGSHPLALEYLSHAVRLNPHFTEAHYHLGRVLAAQGRLAEAVTSYQQALRLQPDHAGAHNNLGVAWMAQGRLAEAVTSIQQALRFQPEYAWAHNNLGLAQKAQGRLAEAVASFQEAVRLQPDLAAAHNNLGIALAAQGQPAEAVASFQQAVRSKPDWAEAHNNLGIALAARGKVVEAVASYRQALRLQPDYAEAHNNLGAALAAQGQVAEAVASYQQALRLRPVYAEAHNNLGAALAAQGQVAEAVASFQQALRFQPDYAWAHFNLGLAQNVQGQVAEAVASFQQAVRFKPDLAAAHHNLGIALAAQGGLAEAVVSLRQALRLQPDNAEAHNNLGAAFKQQGHLAQAEASFQAALRLRPDYAEGYSNLGSALVAQGKVTEGLACYQKALRLQPGNAQAHGNRLLALQYRDGVTLSELAEAHIEFGRRLAAPLRATWKPPSNAPDPDRRLRLGFVSPDLRRHPVGYFLIRFLENLDRGQGEAICYYSNRPTQDELTTRIRAAATTWWEVFGWSDQRLAEQIRADQIDILFDLAGHTAQNGLLVFARKPAPLQVTWAGYVGTTGLQAMDYILADRYEIPPEAEGYYCEKVLRMPDDYVCYDPPSYAPPVSPLPALERGYVTFGSFNNPAKIGPHVVAVWARVLQRLPLARLVLKYQGMDDAAVAHRLGELFAGHGIEPGRVELLGWSPHPELLAHYHRIDLAVDPFPYNGGLSTCEALWMGVPVLTCPGETFASRHSLTHLSTVGLTETISGTLEEYVELAVSLAGDLPRLAGIRGRLRPQVNASPLCDGKLFAENLMQLLRDVWRDWVAQGGR